MRQSVRRPVLALKTFEDRATPAVLSGYAVATGTLTISARSGDVITVSNDATDIPGQLTITDGTGTVFTSNGRPVQNLVITGGQAASYNLGFGDDVVLNNLTVGGGTTSTGVIVGATTRIARAFTFNGSTAGGNDSIQFDPGSRIGGGARINLRGGNNGLFLDGGYVGGNVLVTAGGAEFDEVGPAAGDLTIGGTLSLRLGNGQNNVLGAGLTSVSVGWNFLYAGGADNDNLDFQTNGTALSVSGSLSLALGDAGFGQTDLYDWVSGPLYVGGDFLATGGPGADEIGLFGDTQIDGGLIANLGDFTNQLFIGYDGTGTTTIGGDLGYSGGVGFDAAYVDNTAVGGNAVFNLGSGFGNSQFVQLGTRQDAGVLIDGSLSITTGAENDDIRIYSTTVSTKTFITTGAGDDFVFLDDVDLIGAVSVNLGAGNDRFEVEAGADNGNGVALTGIARFGDALTVDGRGGDDTIVMRGPDGDQIRAAGRVRLIGGGGVDTLDLPGDAGDVYLGVVTEDLESGDSF
ncbi:MAG TPA: hypothetical protein VM597_35550 [Gemmataceae bacterium]|nr:hypothetical protein [Gemmataceae bacterium]